MKSILFCLILIYAQTAHGQQETDSMRLGTDKNFLTYVQRNLRFPADAMRQGIAATIYAGFMLHEQRHIQAITILNTQKMGYSFEREVIAFLKRLPKQPVAYKGDYTLPFFFGYSNGPTDKKLTFAPGTLPDELLGQRIKMSPMTVVGFEVRR